MIDYVQLAQSLKDNEAFQAALDLTRQAAIDGLCAANPDDKNSIIAMQATVRVVDDIRGNLERFLSEGKPQKRPGIA